VARDSPFYEGQNQALPVQTPVGRTFLGEPSFGSRMAAVLFMWRPYALTMAGEFLLVFLGLKVIDIFPF